MEYRILGPLEVCDGDRRVPLGGDKQRAVLAMLLLHANVVVSADRLIDALWGEQPPPTALKTLHAYISRLRKGLDANGELSSLSSNEVLVTRGHGYLLRVESGELDTDRFRGLLEEGRRALAAGEPDRAAIILREGLALWRGPPLGEFAYEAFATQAIAQLEELYLGALEERVEADLALGRHRDLVGELAAMVEQNPHRERLRAELMLTLYRCGRHPEALAVYQEYRRVVSEELGLDPGLGLQQLELAILNRDPSLDLQLARGASAEPTTRLRARRWPDLKPGRVGLVVGGSVVIAVAVAAVVLTSSGGGARSLSVIAADSVGAINPAGDAIAAQVPVGSSPSRLAAGEGAVWVSNYNASTVSRIDPATRVVVQTIQAGSTPSGIAVGAGAVWVANTLSGTVSRIDPAVNRVVQPIPVGNGPSGVAVGDGSVWVTNSSDATLSRIDAVSGTVTKTITLGGGATDVAVGAGAVWVSDEAGRRVLRVDPGSNQVTASINIGTGPSAIAVGHGSVWVANSLDGTVSRIDPQTNTVTAAIAVGDGPGAIAVGAGGVWVANEFGGSVARINPATGEVVRTITVGNRARGLTVADGLVWVGAQASGNSHRGGTLTVLSNVSPRSLDPAQTYNLGGYTLLTNDGLTALKRVGGSDGAQVVPDLATSLPAPTDGGTTYTFQLRRGIRYSNGMPVRPEDFRRALERDFKLGDANAPVYYANVVGGAACAAHPARCDLSQGITTNDAADTVTFHLVAPDPELLDRLAVWDAVAVPAGAPNHDVGSHPLPATGAYKVTSLSSSELRYVRNPYFHEWSRAARPDGYPDQIVVRFGASPSAELTAVERGSADFTIDGPPPDRLTEVQTRFASQLHVNPNDVLNELVLNTRVAPFTDLRVRRALNYAIDRAAIARLVDPAALPTCQFLTPYIFGYARYCPYTLDPSSGGAWRVPDLAQAQRLIAASHTRGTPITVWSLGAYGDASGIGRYVVSLLDRLGYPARLRNLVADKTAPGRFADSRTKAQVALLVYLPNYPAPSEFIKWFLSCQNFVRGSAASSNWSEFCDPRLDAQIRSALQAQGTDAPAAAAIWAKADKTVTDQAPLVPLVIPSQIDFVSRRVGNYEYNPQMGVLVEQLWVR
jgi:YVTN family beta-propeller protein